VGDNHPGRTPEPLKATEVRVTLSIETTTPDVLLSGDVYDAADNQTPVASKVCIKATASARLRPLPKGIYFYQFNAPSKVEFTLSSDHKKERAPFDTRNGGGVLEKFVFEVDP
jgi:hypothetical protein